MSLSLISLVIAVILWFLAAIRFPKDIAVDFGWLGMFFYGLSMLIK